MDTTRGILFLVVTLIIIVSIYYIVKMVKGRTPLSPSPSSSDQTDKISISDLKFERTLNPDKSNSKGDDGIAGYTIEYSNGINGEGSITSPSGINYKELSENVTFTLKWTNNIGFTDNVKGFMIEHYVEGVSKQSIDFYKTDVTVTGDPIVYVENFQENTVYIKSDGTYSVVGENRFKISVIMNDDDADDENKRNRLLIYDGTAPENGASHQILISKNELGATLSMTQPETVTYTPVTRSFESTTVNIKKVKYSITNKKSSLNYDGGGSIYLIPAFPKKLNDDGKVEDVDTFFLKYEIGENQYLLQDGKKGEWNKNTKRERGDDLVLTNEHDNRMFVSFYDKDEDETDGKVTAQLRYTKMGYGLGTHAITTDKDGKLELMSVSDTDTISQTLFENSVWKFTEVKGDPVDCIGGWVIDNDGITDGLGKKVEIFVVTTEMQNNGKKCEASEGDIKRTDVKIDCSGYYDQKWGDCSASCGGGTQTKEWHTTITPKHGGKECPSPTISQSCNTQACNPFADPGAARH